PNATTIKFSHSLRIGFSAIIANSDPNTAEQKINEIWWHIMNRLWKDAVIMNVLDASNPLRGTTPLNPDNIQIESLTRGTMRERFGASGLNNETPIAELQYDVTVFFRTYWEPGPFDNLNTIDVKTGIEPGDSDYVMSGRPQAHVVYDFTQQNAPFPAVTGVAPVSGPKAGGTSVIITGTDFTNATAVTFGNAGAAASFTVNSATQITAVSPAGSHTVDLTVTTPAGTSELNAADQFSFT
ncbi:MAG TPA: IPT/TIG domain-containing protein, partial [Pirellulales bacterium]|nr:IPT/TIG domain-containing protein [Pirellulales bacterium]